MTAKEYLLQYRAADREINAKLEQIRRLRELATKTTQVLSSDRVQSSAENKVERIVSKIADLESEVDEDIDKMQVTKNNVEKIIKAVPDASQRAVLIRRYINGEPWSRICTAFYGDHEDFPDRYDSYLRTIYRRHGYALHVVQLSLNVTTNA